MRCCRSSLIVLSATVCSSLVLPPAPLIVVGPGDTNTQLLTAKLAAAAGHRVQCVTRVADVRNADRLMYGGAEPPECRPLFACANTQIASALGAAEGMVLCLAGGKAPPSTSGIGTMLPYASRLRRIVVLSAIGGSTGNTGGLGEGELVQRCEAEVAAAAAAAGVEVSIVRVGVLKGGAAAEQPTGLDEAAFYASLCAGGYPTPPMQCAKMYDRQTLGVSVCVGDSVEARNAAQRSATRTSAERARVRSRTNATATGGATAPLRPVRPVYAPCAPRPRSARRRRLAHQRGGRAPCAAAPRGAARGLALGGGGRSASIRERMGPGAHSAMTLERMGYVLISFCP